MTPVVHISKTFIRHIPWIRFSFSSWCFIFSFTLRWLIKPDMYMFIINLFPVFKAFGFLLLWCLILIYIFIISTISICIAYGFHRRHIWVFNFTLWHPFNIPYDCFTIQCVDINLLAVSLFLLLLFVHFVPPFQEILYYQ